MHKHKRNRAHVRGQAHTSNSVPCQNSWFQELLPRDAEQLGQPHSPSGQSLEEVQAILCEAKRLAEAYVQSTLLPPPDDMQDSYSDHDDGC